MASRSSTGSAFVRLLTDLLKRYVLWWYAVTAFLYFGMIPLTIWIFPATNLLLTVVVLFSGFTASIASLASVLVDAKQDDQIEDLEAKR